VAVDGACIDAKRSDEAEGTGAREADGSEIDVRGERGSRGESEGFGEDAPGGVGGGSILLTESAADSEMGALGPEEGEETVLERRRPISAIRLASLGRREMVEASLVSASKSISEGAKGAGISLDSDGGGSGLVCTKEALMIALGSGGRSRRSGGGIGVNVRRRGAELALEDMGLGLEGGEAMGSNGDEKREGLKKA